jgi:trimeric autotransporter adhesin
MTSNNQVSPAIRISRGERDASARATHLKAASRKYLETTIERKQMSTTTNFKRIALVAVAALGLGVLSSVPSQATINADTVTLSSATASQTTAETYTATSAIATVSFFGAVQDSMSITAELVSTTAVGNTSLPALRLIETSSAVIDSLVASTTPGNYGAHAGGQLGVGVAANTATSVTAFSSSVTTVAKYAVYLAGTAAVPTAGTTAAPAQSGTYVVRIKPAAIGKTVLVGSSNQTLTITVSAAPEQSTALSATNTKIYMQSGDTDAKLAAQDSTIVGLKTANGLAAGNVANIWINAKNASNVAFAKIESVTATISGAGSLGANPTVASATSQGRSLLVNPLTDYIAVFPDGNSGVGTITFTGATSGVVLGTKTVTFSGTVVEKFATPTIAATDSSVVNATGANTTTVSVLAQDLSSNLVSGLVAGTDFYAFSSDTSVATVAYSSYSATTGYAFTVTGAAVGTTNISFGNASTLAASTIKSGTVAVRVGSATPSSVTVTTDKTSYAPGEKITVTVTILDSTGKAVTGKNVYSNIFSSTGIVPGLTLSGTNTLPAGTDVTDYSNLTNTKTYTIYAPVTGGKLDFTYTGGTALATANQVAKTVSVTVVDSGSAALAAVTALATTVASLRTLIVTLTNLVLKIQKKVKA